MVDQHPARRTGVPRAAIAAATVLGVALVVAVVVISRLTPAPTPPPPQDTRPLAVVPVPAPQAGTPECARLVGALPAALPSGGAVLHRLTLAAPAPPATAAWGTSTEPVTLRCGLVKPAELTPTAQLLVIDGVSWLRVADGGRATYYAVDRPVYVALTLPGSAGSGPLQEVSAKITGLLPARRVTP